MYYQLFDPSTTNTHYYKVTDNGVLHVNPTTMSINVLPKSFDLSTASNIHHSEFKMNFDFVLCKFQDLTMPDFALKSYTQGAY